MTQLIDISPEHINNANAIYLTPYLPDLNPIERIWKHLRCYVTHNVYFETLEAFEDAIINYLKEHFKPNKTLKPLCCIN